MPAVGNLEVSSRLLPPTLGGIIGDLRYLLLPFYGVRIFVSGPPALVVPCCGGNELAPIMDGTTVVPSTTTAASEPQQRQLGKIEKALTNTSCACVCVLFLECPLVQSTLLRGSVLDARTNSRAALKQSDREAYGSFTFPNCTHAPPIEL